MRCKQLEVEVVIHLERPEIPSRLREHIIQRRVLDEGELDSFCNLRASGRDCIIGSAMVKRAVA